LANEEHGFFRLYFFTSDLVDLEQILREVDFPGDVVASYVTRVAAAAFQQSEFNPIATRNTPITCPRKIASAVTSQMSGSSSIARGAGLSTQYVSSLADRR